ncbi:hypothetical protein D8Y22_06580 [Salinadaptatus halalkaliphilus]|uniref:Domain of unknown function domain-containing protein n=2 Tax=Salinadaptatus halalkaliphilus TaxID=2419781 RepID=A0A4S3TQR0_9EURY|nr:hypothetical protein D8Y22_06580 [Salinadaptatus halalkaliphilus]
MRELLKLEPENDNRIRDRRTKIRKRVRDGLYDFTYLNQYAKETDVRQIFDHKYEVPNQVKGVEHSDTEESKAAISSQMNVPGQFVPVRHMIQFAYRGMRANGMDADEFVNKILEPSIQKGEAKHKDVDRGQVECDLTLKTLEVHYDKGEMDPIEKWERGLGLSSDDIRTLHKRVSEHPEVEETLGRDIGELINKYLVDDPDD